MTKQQLTITQRVNDFKDICAIAGKDPAAYQVTEGMDDEERFAIAAKKVRLIAQVLNEGVKLDWKDSTTRKWVPYFYWQGSAFVFARSVYLCGDANATLGSRFASEELSNFAARTFPEEFKDFYNAQ